MKKLISLFLFLFLAGGSSAFSQDMSSEEMAKWTEAMTPGKQQQMLANSVGTWNLKNTMWMAPNTEPMVSTGTCVNEMILGGRYLQGKVSASMMGMPFEGISLTAYDNAGKQYQNTWIDNMGTGIMYTTGSMGDDGKLSMTGTMIDPMTGNTCKIREVLTFNSDNSMTMDMYGPDRATGVEYKMMTIEYTR
jgi:hypothetical protein